MDNVWRAPAVTDRTATFVEHVHTLNEVEHPGEIEGIAFDPATGEMLVLHNRGKRVVLGMPKGLYPGYEREISEIHVYARR